MRLGKLLHLFQTLLVQYEGEIEGLGDGLVGYVVVRGSDTCQRLVNARLYAPDSLTSRGDDKVVVCAHAANRFDNLALIVGNNLDTLEVDAEREAVFGKPSRVRVDRLFESQPTLAIGNTRDGLCSWRICSLMLGHPNLSTKHLIANDQARGRVYRSLIPFGHE